MSIILFAGTSEGRHLAEFLSKSKIDATVCVATEYGALVLPELPHITVHMGRLTAVEMQAKMDSNTLVIDSTHPYAHEVSKNIALASQNSGAEYVRLVRPIIESDANIVVVEDTKAAAQFLNEHTGSALLTTGSKELAIFTNVHRFEQRLWVRVLSSAEVMQKCEELGYKGSNIIAMQGPFSKLMNIALLKQCNAKFLVTKDTGVAGGFAEKLQAASELGVTVVLIARPTKETGYTIEQIKEMLKKRFNIDNSKQNIMKFPVFTDLRGKKCVVVGNGKIATRRIETLIKFGADIKIIAPNADNINAECISREYCENDVDGAFLVVATTDNSEINANIARECRHKNILCSVANDASISTFFFPAIVQNEDLCVGIVSDGTKHALTAKTAEQIRQLEVFYECDKNR